MLALGLSTSTGTLTLPGTVRHSGLKLPGGGGPGGGGGHG